jgi:transcriptional regulator with PAS, ATPase and Fis domain
VNQFTVNYNPEIIIDHIDEGIIYTDKQGFIKVFNKKAKEIIGIDLSARKSHPAGKIQQDDIVIICDNQIGGDDGGLTVHDLESINIHDKKIRVGDAIIAVGVFKNADIKSIYKFWRRLDLSYYELKTEYLGFTIKASIDLLEKKMAIEVNNEVYEMKFINTLGYMVVIDKNNGSVKFYQAKGYTVRKENIKNLLEETFFSAKGNLKVKTNVIDKHITEIIEDSEIITNINNAIQSKKSNLEYELFDINKTPTLCSVLPVHNNQSFEGIIIKMQDVSEIEKLLENRNEVLKNIEKLESRYTDFNQDSPPVLPGFIGNSILLNEVKYLAKKASEINSTVLITGENGTGKSFLAKEIHNLDDKGKPFIHVNCSAIPYNLFESELFGYERGSFTGAKSDGKIGYFEQAEGGTIFLDEIGELPKEIQAKLLHVLQSKSFYKIGGLKPININVRVIAATNKNLEREIETGSFREDLYYRINVFPISIPSLRERKNDIYIFINNILNRLSNEYKLEQKQLSGSAFDKLIKYSWPGNVRELENVLERAFNICNTHVIQPEHLNIKINDYMDKRLLKDALMETEKKFIAETLIQCNYDKKEAMQRLDMSKTNFYEKLKLYKL